MKSLDLEAVQAFVLVAELKSFTRAATVMATTQSAVSLKIKRLEEGLGQRLLERTPRRVRLSAEGSHFLGPARSLVAAHDCAIGAFAVEQHRLAVGISHNIVGAELPLLLRRLSEREPALVLEMRLGKSREMLDLLDAGALDAAIVLGQDERRPSGEILLQEEFCWMSGPDFVRRDGDVLRLATQVAPCSVRSMAIAALESARIPWSEVFVGGGVATIAAAAAAGLAVAALCRRVAPSGTVDVGPRLGLPPLPTQKVVLHSSLSDRRAKESLRAVAAAIKSTAC